LLFLGQPADLRHAVSNFSNGDLIANWLKIDEFHVSVFLLPDVTSALSAAARRALAGRSFQNQLRAAVRCVPEQFSKSATEPSHLQPLMFRK